ncbi:hypothetical protein LE181_03060 [Streptomyces sp. SCA3-4]|nr:hypothetical protein [Streptomyces sichuanensis]MCA6091150.1 hypothetical protein [Streptomyces sichuanensis]
MINAFSGGIEAVGTSCEYVIVYVTATTGTFTAGHGESSFPYTFGYELD